MATTTVEGRGTDAATARASLHWAPRRIEPTWWTTANHEGHPLREALRRRDVTTIFRFLKTRGWSTAAIGAATGLSENRVRAILQGRQTVGSYEVLERIAAGLHIDRGLMGLAYTFQQPRPHDRGGADTGATAIDM